MKKILVVTTSLSCGGITSFLIPLLNLLQEQGHDVSLAYTKDTADFLSRINSKVKKIQFKQHSKWKMLFEWIINLAFYDIFKLLARKSNEAPNYASIQRLSYINAKYISFDSTHYDIAISSAEGFCNALVAYKISAEKKIGWVHPDMAKIGLDIVSGKNVLDQLNNVVAVSHEGYETLQSLFQNDKDKFLYIENLIDADSIKQRSKERVFDFNENDDCMRIVTICRISNESKRLDRVVNVAKILKLRKFNFKWFIIGDGPDKGLILQLIKKYGLDDDVILLGGRSNPLPYLSKADLFVLTSQYEGKPVVVEEAKVLHVPIIVTKYSSALDQVTNDLGAVVSNIDGKLEGEIASLITSDSFIKSIRSNNSNYECDNSKSVNKIIELLN